MIRQAPLLNARLSPTNFEYDLSKFNNQRCSPPFAKSADGEPPAQSPVISQSVQQLVSVSHKNLEKQQALPQQQFSPVQSRPLQLTASRSHSSPPSATIANGSSIVAFVISDNDNKCAVCGERAPYIFYGTRACDSCRTFFRRHVVLNSSKSLRCRFDAKCDIGPGTRKRCTTCRLAKCHRVGMKAELVVVEKNTIHVNGDIDHLNDHSSNSRSWSPNGFCHHDQSPNNSPSGLALAIGESSLPIPPAMSASDFIVQSGRTTVVIKSLSSLHKNKLHELAYAGSMLKTLIPDVDVLPDEPERGTLGFLTTISVGTQKTMLCTKELLVFKNLCPSDMKLVATDGFVEILIAWSLFVLDEDFENWVVTCFKPCTQNLPDVLSTDVLKFANDNNQLFDNYMRLARTFDPSWRRDPFLLCLVCVICLYGDREGLQDEDDVTNERNLFSGLLMRYVEAMYGRRREVEARLAMSKIFSILGQVADLRQQFREVQMDLTTPLRNCL